MNPGPEPEYPILIIDTASPTTMVGLGVSKEDWHWLHSNLESGVALFQLVARLTREQATPLKAVRTVAYCDGPGSMLGIRTTAMAIRTWVASLTLDPVALASYSSLALAAAGIRAKRVDGAFAVAIDARRQSWYGLTDSPEGHGPAEIKRIPSPSADTLGDRVYLPEGFPVWNDRPADWLDCAYQPRLLESPTLQRRLFRPIEQPEAFQLDPPIFQKWTPAVNRTRPRSPHPEETQS